MACPAKFSFHPLQATMLCTNISKIRKRIHLPTAQTYAARAGKFCRMKRGGLRPIQERFCIYIKEFRHYPANVELP